MPRQQGQSEGDFTPENALRGAPISTWQVQKNLRLEWGHLLLNLQFKGVRSAGDSIVVMRISFSVVAFAFGKMATPNRRQFCADG